MAHKYFADQMDDEEVLYVFRKHPIVMRKGLVIGMLIILLSTVPVAIKPTLGFGWFFGSIGIGLVVALVFFAPSWISWYYSIFILSDQRLIQITQKGLFNKAVVDMQLSQIQMVNYQVAGLQETMLGFGTIVMQTYMGDLVIHDVHHPAKTQKKILEVLRDNGVSAASYGAETPGERSSSTMELETDDDSEE
jgi:signal transduction histidine kinase